MTNCHLPSCHIHNGWGHKNGEILRGPSLLSFTAVSSMVVIPPIPEPIITPIRSGSTCCTGAVCNSLIKPACFKACAAAATPYLHKGVIPTRVFGVHVQADIKPIHCAGDLCAVVVASKWLIALIPLSPLMSRCQVLSTSSPSGVMAPCLW